MTLTLTLTHHLLLLSASIHVSDESMIWESALDYCKRENRNGLLRLESHLDQRELKFELRRRRVSGPLWVGLGQGPLSELLKSSSRLALGPWTNRNERQTQPPPSLSPAGTDTVQKSFKQKTDVSKLRPVCEVKQPWKPVSPPWRSRALHSLVFQSSDRPVLFSVLLFSSWIRSDNAGQILKCAEPPHTSRDSSHVTSSLSQMIYLLFVYKLEFLHRFLSY